jgi:TAG lipase/steryl ester hydrolase/phospholipase A2/LPA acyltransferase
MEHAENYEEWLEYSTELDILYGKHGWKEDPVSPFYDYEKISTRLQRLRELIDTNNSEQLLRYLRSRLMRNLGGIGSPELHTYALSGTKTLIEDYQEEVCRALKSVASSKMNNARKLAFFNETRHAFGRSALLLSGGSTLGLYHSGVIMALHENKLLPKIISGSSVGSIFAAFVGTRTDEEIPMLFKKGTISFQFFPSNSGSIWRKIRRMFKDGVLMDINILQECVRANIGDFTFAEAYARTGRVINIVVAPGAGSKEVPRLLNYLSTPNVVGHVLHYSLTSKLIWSAAVASCAIPGVFSSVELMAKDLKGNIQPYYPEGLKWSDGSMHADLPTDRLAELFNVNHFIVSQVLWIMSFT